MHATWLTHLTLLDLITLIIFGEVYKLLSSSACSLLQPPATSFLLGPNILLRTSTIYMFLQQSAIKVSMGVKLYLSL
jgi:hypothetical protein